MEKLLFVVLLITEIVTSIRQIAARVSKREWSKERGITNALELFLFLLMLLLPGIDLSFRFRVLFVLLIIRLILSGIVILICRKNENRKKPAAIVLGTAFGMILIGMSMIPAFIFADYS